MSGVPLQAQTDPGGLEAIVDAYRRATDRLEESHRQLTCEVQRLHGQLAEKNRELARRERLAALGEMAAGVAHEVRNPLGAIGLYASMLDRDLRELPECRRLVRQIASSVRSLDRVVQDILTFAGGEPVHRAPVAMGTVLEETLALVAPQRDAVCARVHVDNAAAAVAIPMDASQVTRALVNLVFNALDAAGEGGNVWIDASHAADGSVRIAVADDGPGVDPAIEARVFNPFFTTKDSGTGLGLSIVHRIAEAHGGRVEVGRRDGGGAVFALVLPAGRTAAGEPDGRTD